MTTSAVRVLVGGKVQGVGFRWFVREEARRSGAAGWVRNLPDGSVEVLVGGAPRAVEHVVNAARVGPDRAHVESFSSAPHQVEGPLPFPFTVLK